VGGSGAGSVSGEEQRMAEEAANVLMQSGGGSGGGHRRISSGSSVGGGGGHPSHLNTPPPLMPGGASGGPGNSAAIVQMQSSIPGNVGMIAQHQHGRRNRRWYLGIQSKKDPAHVMTEVYKALMALGCEWLQLSSYRIKCRWRPNALRAGSNSTVDLRRGGSISNLEMGVMPQPTAGGDSPEAAWNQNQTSGFDTTNNNINNNNSASADMAIDDNGNNNAQQPGGGGESRMKVISGEEGLFIPVPNLNTPDYCIKIGLTLYKVQQNIYLLDFQKMTGDAFSFMTLCANIITELKTLSAASKQHQALLQQQAAALAQQQQQAAMQAQGVGGGAGEAVPPQQK